MPHFDDNGPKPYELVKIKAVPSRQKPVGHDALKKDKLTGSISLEMTVQTAAFVAAGAIALGTDVIRTPSAVKPKLIKIAITKDDKFLIPGSSFKGVVRSTYEAITASCLCKTRAKAEKIPNGYRECNRKDQLCSACRIFGAMGWQGLVSFQDVLANKVEPSVGYMPSLYGPRNHCERYYDPQTKKVLGRKFYYHSNKAIAKTPGNGISVQQAAKNLVLTTELQFMNLTKAELGTLLIVLGQDINNPFALKIGGGKPIGMGTVTIKVRSIDRPENLRSRYSSYDAPESDILTGERLKKEMQTLIAAAHKENLVQKEQLNQLKEILKLPADYEPRTPY